jgi:hypothetical protein
MRLASALGCSFVAFVACLAACGSTDPVPVDDAGPSSTLDASTASDAARKDASSSADGAVPIDAGGDSASAVDASGSDSGPPPPAGKGQCYLDAQCGAGKTCVATAPGGFCQGCTGDTCNVADADQCNFGTCNASCAKDADCAYGLRCNTSGTCILKTCSAASPCDATHACDGGFCRRIKCTGGTACPSGTQCRNTPSGELCVESYLSYP